MDIEKVSTWHISHLFEATTWRYQTSSCHHCGLQI